jgi:hypothetical protein
MILLAGIPSEPPLALAIASAEAAGAAHVVLNQRAFAHDKFEFSFVDGRCSGALVIGMQVYPVEHFTGIYTRMTDPACLPELQAGRRRRASSGEGSYDGVRARAWAEVFDAWLELGPLRVANRSSASATNFSKPAQLQRIRACGFSVPETLVTNLPELVRAFVARHRRVVYKSTSAVRSIVRMLDDEALRTLDRIALLPTQFQAFVPGEDVRVHVVGEEVFATLIVSAAVDYRYAGRDGISVEMRPFSLPIEIAMRCVALSQTLGLAFSGIDLRRTPAGEYFCFEVNPSPAYSYYQEQTDVAISDALVQYLLFGSSRTDTGAGSHRGADR